MRRRIHRSKTKKEALILHNERGDTSNFLNSHYINVSPVKKLARAALRRQHPDWTNIYIEYTNAK